MPVARWCGLPASADCGERAAVRTDRPCRGGVRARCSGPELGAWWRGWQRPECGIWGVLGAGTGTGTGLKPGPGPVPGCGPGAAGLGGGASDRECSGSRSPRPGADQCAVPGTERRAPPVGMGVFPKSPCRTRVARTRAVAWVPCDAVAAGRGAIDAVLRGPCGALLGWAEQAGLRCLRLPEPRLPMSPRGDPEPRALRVCRPPGSCLPRGRAGNPATMSLEGGVFAVSLGCSNTGSIV